MPGTNQVRKNLRAAMKDALRIQERFVPEPVFARTGRGYLKSEGVKTLQTIQAHLKNRRSAPCKNSG